MSVHVTFEQPVNDGRVRGSLALPADTREAVPALLICDGVEADAATMDDLWEALTESMLQQEIAMARFRPRCAELIHDDFHTYSAKDHLADLTASLDWLAGHNAIAATQIGLIGYGVGGATAACLAGQSERIARLCLLSASAAGSIGPSRTTTIDVATNGKTDASGNGEANGATDHDLPRAYTETVNDLAPLEKLCSFARPLLLLHGAADRIVEPENLFLWSDAAEAGNGYLEPCLIARADHHFGNPHLRAACVDQIERFFGQLHPIGQSRKRR